MTINRVIYIGTPHHEEVSPIIGICELANAADDLYAWMQAVVVFSGKDKERAKQTLKPQIKIFCFEDELAKLTATSDDMERLERTYKDIFFGNVIAGERVFGDYSFLMGALGFRHRNAADIWSMVTRTTVFFERIYKAFNPDAVVSFVPDNYFSDISIVLAEALSIKLLIPQISQLAGSNKAAAGFWGRTRYLESYQFMRLYNAYLSRQLNQEEAGLAQGFISDVLNYDPHKTHQAFGTTKLRAVPISPRWRKVLWHSLFNKAPDSITNYNAPSFLLKSVANITRIARFFMVKMFLLRRQTLPSAPFVYLPLHFQPEASTLIHGLYASNQITLIEQISKSLPLGVLLVVKEHEKGRGNRPLWQYKHMESFYNVQVCDRPSVEILRQCKAVLTITGTVAVEAVAYRKPAIIFGRKHYFFPSFFYRCYDYCLLPALLKKVLLGQKEIYTDQMVSAFFLAWASSQIDVVPLRDNLHKLAPFLKPELEEDYANEIAQLAAIYPLRNL